MTLSAIDLKLFLSLSINSQQASIVMLLFEAIIIVIAFVFYGNQLQKIFLKRGSVSIEKFDLPDLILGSFLTAWFVLVVISGFTNEPRAVKNSDLLEGSVIFILVVVGIGSFLHYRGINIFQVFGLNRMSFWKAFFRGMLFLMAAFPLILCVNLLTQSVNGDSKPQEIIEFFGKALKNSDYWSLISMSLLSIVLAPIAEEFIFRGYLYSVFKRYIGMIGAILLNAILFAAIHGNSSALPALFVLALCFTIAYEATGSLIVSISMHALFNLIMVIAMINFPQFSK